MRGRDIIKAIMEAKNISNADAAKRLGLTAATMWARVNEKKQNDIPVSRLAETVRVMDYKVVVIPANCRIPEGGYEVD